MVKSILKRIWKEFKIVFTPKKKPVTPTEIAYQILFTVLLLAIIIGSAVIIDRVSIAWSVLSPDRGYDIFLPMSFDIPNVVNYTNNMPLVDAVVRLNTTTYSGFGFIALTPIEMNITARVIDPKFGTPATSQYAFNFQNAQPYNDITGYRIESYGYRGIGLHYSYQTATWEGTGKFFFLMQGNYQPQLTLWYNGTEYKLHQVSDMVIPVDPANNVQTTMVNQANLLLAVAIYFLGLVESLTILSKVYHKGFRQEAKYDSDYD